MKRRILAMITAVCMVMMLLPASIFAAPAYSDTENHWASGSIERWSHYGIVEGRDDGRFDPNGQLTRGEAAKILANLLGLREEADLSGFTDVGRGVWYDSYIAKCVAAGILYGYEDGRMAPNNAITREEFFVMYARALGIPEEPAMKANSFADAAAVSSWAAGSINALVNKGYVNGITPELMAPGMNIDRASVMSLLDKSISTYVNSSGTKAEAKPGGVTLVAAKNVTVTGTADMVVVARGAGSVTLENISANDLNIQTENTKVTAKNASVRNANITGSGANLVLDGGRAENIQVAEDAQGAKVDLIRYAEAGSIGTEAPGSTVNVLAGKVDHLQVAATAAGAQVDVGRNASVQSVDTLAENVQIAGEGKVDKVTAGGNNTSVDTKGTQVQAMQGTTGVTAGSQPVAGGASAQTPVPPAPRPRPAEPAVPITDTVYVGGGSDSNSGASADAPVATLEKAMELLLAANPASGKIQLVGSVSVPERHPQDADSEANGYQIPAHSFPLEIYSENGSSLLLKGNLLMGGDVHFHDVGITKSSEVTNRYIVANCHKLTMGDNLVTTPYTANDGKNTYMTLVGASYGTDSTGDSCLTVNSGRWAYIYGSLHSDETRVHSGNAVLNINGGTFSCIVGAGYKGTTDGNVTINMRGGTTQPSTQKHGLFAGTIYGTVTGDVLLNVCGATADAVHLNGKILGGSREKEGIIQGKITAVLSGCTFNGNYDPLGKATVAGTSTVKVIGPVAIASELTVDEAAGGTITILPEGKLVTNGFSAPTSIELQDPANRQIFLQAPDTVADDAFTLVNQGLTVATSVRNSVKQWTVTDGGGAPRSLTLNISFPETVTEYFTANWWYNKDGYEVAETSSSGPDANGYVTHSYEGVIPGIYSCRIEAPGCYNEVTPFYITEEDLAVGYKNVKLELTRAAGTGWEPEPSPDGISQRHILPGLQARLTTDGLTMDGQAPFEEIHTPAFGPGKNDFQFTTHQEMLDLIAELDAKNDKMHVLANGTSRRGLEMPLVLFTPSAIPDGATVEEAAEIVKGNGKVIIQVTSAVHGNEPSAAEGVLLMFQALCGDYDSTFDEAAILENANIYFIPRLNPDGLKDNLRRNPTNDEDMNRDWVRANNQEVRSVLRAFRAFMPDMTIDMHEFLGDMTKSTSSAIATDADGNIFLNHFDDIGITGSASLNSDPETNDEITEKMALPTMKKLQSMGLRAYDYSPTKAVALNHPYFGLHSCYSFLLETRGIKLIKSDNYARRTFSHYAALRELFSYAAAPENSERMHQHVKDVRAQVIEAGKTYSEDKQLTIGAYKAGIKVYPMPRPSFNLDGSYRDKDRVEEIRLYDAPLATRSSPTAYVLPVNEGSVDICTSLRQSGAEIFYVAPGGSVMVQQYRQNELGNDTVAALTEEKSVTFPDGAFVITMDQEAAKVIGLYLEIDNTCDVSQNTILARKLIQADIDGFYPLYRHIRDNPRTQLTMTAAPEDLVELIPAPARPEDLKPGSQTIYVSASLGAPSNDGLTKGNPVDSLDRAVVLLTKAGFQNGKICLLDKIDLEHRFTIPDHIFQLEIYAEDENGKIGLDGSFILGGPTHFHDMAIVRNNSADTRYLVCNNHKTVIGDNCITVPFMKGDTAIYPSITAGGLDSSLVTGDTDLTIASGTWDNAYGATYNTKSHYDYVHDGSAKLTLTGGTFGTVTAGTFSGTTTGNVELVINGSSAHPVTINTGLYVSSVIGSTEGNVTATLTGDTDGAIILNGPVTGGRRGDPMKNGKVQKAGVTEGNIVFNLSGATLNGTYDPKGFGPVNGTITTNASGPLKLNSELTVDNFTGGALTLTPTGKLIVTGAVSGTAPITLTEAAAGQVVAQAPEAASDGAFTLTNAGFSLAAATAEGVKTWTVQAGGGSQTGPAVTDTVYVSDSGSDTNDGTSAETPVATLDKALALLNAAAPAAGKLVLVGKVTAPAQNAPGGPQVDGYQMPDYSYPLEIYADTSGGKLLLSGNFFLGGPTHFHDMEFVKNNSANLSYLVCNCHKTLIGDNCITTPYTNPADGKSTYMSLVGGGFRVSIVGDTDLTINCGRWTNIYGATYNGGSNKSNVHTGSSNLTVNGGTFSILTGTGYEGTLTGDATVTITGCEMNAATTKNVGIYPGSIRGILNGSATLNIQGAKPEDIVLHGRLTGGTRETAGKVGGNVVINISGMTYDGDFRAAGSGDVTGTVTVNVTGPIVLNSELEADTFSGDSLVLGTEGKLIARSVTGPVSVELLSPANRQVFIQTPESVADDAFSILTDTVTIDIVKADGLKKWTITDGGSAPLSLTLNVILPEAVIEGNYYTANSWYNKSDFAVTETATSAPQDGYITHTYADVRAGIYSVRYTAPGCYNLCQAFLITEEDLAVGHKDVKFDLVPSAGTGYEPSSGPEAATQRSVTEGLQTLLTTDDLTMDGQAPFEHITTPALSITSKNAFQFTTEAEMLAFLNDLAGGNPNMYVYSAGKSSQNLEMPLVIFTRVDLSGAATLKDAAALVRNDDKLTVQITAGVHGNEPSSSEGTLLLMQALCGQYDSTFAAEELLQNMNIYIIPRVNPNGLRDHSRTNPDNGADMNRDYARANNVEIQHVLDAYQLFMPDMTVDMHEYTGDLTHSKSTEIGYDENGSAYLKHFDDIRVTSSSNINSDAATNAEVMQMAVDTIKELQSLGLRAFDYSQTKALGLNHPYFGLHSCYSFLLETRGIKLFKSDNYERRIFSHYAGLRSLLRYADAHAADIHTHVGDVRAKMIEDGKTYSEDKQIILDVSKSGNTAYTLPRPSFNMDGTPRDLSRVESFQVYDKPVKTRPSPTAYVLPVSEDALTICKSLMFSGAEIRMLAPNQALPLVQYKQETVGNDSIAELMTETEVSFPKGAYVITMDQECAKIIALYLEIDNGCDGTDNTILKLGLMRADSEGRYPLYRYIRDNPSTALTLGAFTDVVPEDPKPSGTALVYVSETGSNENTGAAADQAVATLDKAMDLLAAANPENGRICIVGNVTLSATYHFPEHSFPLEVFSDGTGQLSLNGNLYLGGETLFHDITLKNLYKSRRTIYAECHKLTIGEHCTTLPAYGSDGPYLALVGGAYIGNITGDCDMTVKSGYWEWIIGGSYNLKSANRDNIHTGNVTLNLDGGSCSTLVGGCWYGDTTGNITINITNLELKKATADDGFYATSSYDEVGGNVTVNIRGADENAVKLIGPFTGGSHKSLGVTTGDVVINLSGATFDAVYEREGAGTVKGTITLTASGPLKLNSELTAESFTGGKLTIGPKGKLIAKAVSGTAEVTLVDAVNGQVFAAAPDSTDAGYFAVTNQGLTIDTRTENGQILWFVVSGGTEPAPDPVP